MERVIAHSRVVYFADEATDRPVEIDGGGGVGIDGDDSHGEDATDFTIANAANESLELATNEGWRRGIYSKPGIIVAPAVDVANDGRS